MSARGVSGLSRSSSGNPSENVPCRRHRHRSRHTASEVSIQELGQSSFQLRGGGGGEACLERLDSSWLSHGDLSGDGLIREAAKGGEDSRDMQTTESKREIDAGC